MPDIGVFGLIKEDTDKQNIIEFRNNGKIITELRNDLPSYSRANPLTKAKISRSPGLVIKLFIRIAAESEDSEAKYNTNVARLIVEAVENPSNIATVHLQGTQATLNAVETCAHASQTVLRSAEAADVVARNTNASFSAVITSYTRAASGLAMVSSTVSFNINITADAVLDSAKNNYNCYCRCYESCEQHLCLQ
ncbi:hypothetical protein INT48_009110 [Thamnidium elegans]|uniref:Uncharacterized protein n=1 Tax=Thamnidium elegans TaxID=101142 RepID=A0A8H7VVW3_9FUNG|nr:hypothetical protein INT48_009110 [Thamnidium elegans]